MPGKLKIRVDQDKCQGHARCKSLAPELFDLDEFGNAHEVGDGTVPAGQEDKAWLAQTNCPEIAIEVTEDSYSRNEAQTIQTEHKDLSRCPIPRP
jgi:ferredoxin